MLWSQKNLEQMKLSPPGFSAVNGNSHRGLRLNEVMFVRFFAQGSERQERGNSHPLLLLPANQDLGSTRGPVVRSGHQGGTGPLAGPAP